MPWVSFPATLASEIPLSCSSATIGAAGVVETARLLSASGASGTAGWALEETGANAPDAGFEDSSPSGAVNAPSIDTIRG